MYTTAQTLIQHGSGDLAMNTLSTDCRENTVGEEMVLDPALWLKSWNSGVPRYVST